MLIYHERHMLRLAAIRMLLLFQSQPFQYRTASRRATAYSQATHREGSSLFSPALFVCAERTSLSGRSSLGKLAVGQGVGCSRANSPDHETLAQVPPSSLVALAEAMLPSSQPR